LFTKDLSPVFYRCSHPASIRCACSRCLAVVGADGAGEEGLGAEAGGGVLELVGQELLGAGLVVGEVAPAGAVEGLEKLATSNMILDLLRQRTSMSAIAGGEFTL